MTIRIEVAVILGAHGIRGFVRLKSLTFPPERLYTLELSDATGRTCYTLTPQGRSGTSLIASLNDVQDRNAAEALKGALLYAPADQTQEASWIGYAVVLCDGNPFGHVCAMHNFGAGDIVEIETTGGKRELFAYNERTFPCIDEQAKRMTIDPPEEV